jgi:hypothetical protein
MILTLSMCKFCVGTDKRRYEKQPCASQDNHRDVVTGAGNICFQLVQRLSASNFEKSTVCAPESELKKKLVISQQQQIFIFGVIDNGYKSCYACYKLF